MTLAQFVDYVRRRHNATGDAYWSDAELYQMITARSNEVLNVIGLIEATNTSTSTVAGTQAYSFPTSAATVKALLYAGEMLQQISFREWEQVKAGGTTASGTPEKYVVWNRQVLLIPIPAAVGVLTFYVEQYQPYISSATDTVVIPEELHFRLADGVIADMFAKDMNANMATYYENKWLNNHIPAFYRWRSRTRRRAAFGRQTDQDAGIQTDLGLV